MAKYLLIESSDPFSSNDATHFHELAGDLAKEGHAVTLFLVQNGVLPARRSAKSARLGELAERGVAVLADEFSLRERGIAHDRLAAGIKAAPLDVVIDQLADGAKALWH
jgi:sulfur relay (sulfurtransferase) complex TusBCD TusD component (DsrE family)